MGASMDGKRLQGFLLILGLCLLTLTFGCGNDTYTGKITGLITGVDMAGGTVELIDPDGKVVAQSYPVDKSGQYVIKFNSDSLASAEYLLLKAVREGKSVRAVVTGYPGQGDYSGNDTYISPDTEAAVLLCTLGEYLSVEDYAQFLRAADKGVFDESLAASLTFPYREIHDDVATAVTDSFAGRANSLLSADMLTMLILEQNQLLTESIPVAETLDELPDTTRAFTTPEGDIRIIVTYRSTASVINDATPVSVSSSMDNVEGSFKWNSYAVNVNGNELDAVEVRLLAPDPANPRKVKIIRQDPCSLNVSEDPTSNMLTGKFELVSSNAAGLMNYDASGLAPEADNISARFAFNFNSEVQADTIIFRVYFRDVGSNKIVDQFADAVSGPLQEFTSMSFSLTESPHQDKLVVGTVTVKGSVVAQVEDYVDKTRYQSTMPILSYKTLAQTRVNDPTVLVNNLLTSHDSAVQPIDSGNPYSHYVLDFDKLLASKVIAEWNGKAYSNNIPADGGRVPLLLIHGWQGPLNYRSAAKLKEWTRSPVNYFFNFLCYYMATEELYSKYHIYLAHWPSYKHLIFNGQMLTEILLDITKTYPETDLGRGMTDQNVGVTVLTHSTGGLIFRTAAQLYNAFKTTDGSPYGLLRKAILVASPNHGTPGAINTIPNNLSLAGMDLETQSTSDLEWDSFDQVESFFFYSYQDDRSQNRYVQQVLNVKQFDQIYLDQLSQTSTFNPWLLWFNRNFPKTTDGLAGKCILYSGWTILLGHPANFIENELKYAVTAKVFDLVGYNNDSVLPLASNLLAVDKSSPGFYLERATFPWDNYIRDEWYPNSSLFKGESDYNIIVIGSAQDHPLNMDFRLLWDFDHGTIVRGCLSNGSTEQVAALIDAGETTEPGFSDAAKSYDRPFYTMGAWEYSYTAGITYEQAAAKKNILKVDPAFLLLRRDLLEAVE